MSDIGVLLEKLKSPNKDTRYDACEELRVAESLPPEAISALELAAEDEDALVADAARRALLTHRPPLPTSTTRETSSGKGWLDVSSVLGICSIVVGLVVGLMTVQNVTDIAFHRVSNWEYLYNDLLCCQFPGVFLGTLLALIGIILARKQKSKRGLRLSVAGLILYAVLILASVWTIPRAW